MENGGSVSEVQRANKSKTVKQYPQTAAYMRKLFLPQLLWAQAYIMQDEV